MKYFAVFCKILVERDRKQTHRRPQRELSASQVRVAGMPFRNTCMRNSTPMFAGDAREDWGKIA
jgi:hypothetical protein